MALTDGKPALSGRALGLVLIFLTAIIWVAASFVSQLLVTQQEGRTNFNVPPFLLTYLSTSIFTIFLPLVQLKSLLQETLLLRRSFKYKPLQLDEEAAPITAAAEAEADLDADGSISPPSCHTAAAGGAGGATDGLTADLDTAEAAAAADAASSVARASRVAHKEALTAAAQCFLLWFAAQFLFNQSLQLTSVTSNTILSSTSSLFTFALSMIFLREPYSAAKMASIAACIGGTLLVTLSDDSSGGSSGSSVKGSSLAAAIGVSNTTAPTSAPAAAAAAGGPNHSVWGDLLCLVSAAFYACYTIVLRKALPDDDEANVALFFGYVGLLCSMVFAPVVALLAGVGALHLKTIPSKAYLIILVQGILNYCLSDYLWAHAVLLLGPTIATLGLSVQIPVAAVVEAIIGHPKWLSTGTAMAMTLSGTGLIMVGFVAGNMAGGGHVYGSHHRDDPTGGEGSSPTAGLADDSFTDNRRHTPGVPAASRTPTPNGFNTHHSSNTSNTSSSPHGSDSGGEGGDLPQSRLLHNHTQQQSHFDAQVFPVPVSTHACIQTSHGGSSTPRSSSSSSPGRPPGSNSPRRAAAAGHQLLHPKDGRQSPAANSKPQQQQQHQQWESIELSSSFGSEGRGVEQQGLSSGGSPSAAAAAAAVLSGLRPKDQLPTQRSPLGPGNNSSSMQPSIQQPVAAAEAGGGMAAVPLVAGAADASSTLLHTTPGQQQVQDVLQ